MIFLIIALAIELPCFFSVVIMRAHIKLIGDQITGVGGENPE